MSTRLENLLGALAVALSDSLSAEATGAAGHAGAMGAALTVLAQEPGLGIEQLKVPLGLTQSATVRIVDRLVADGYAERRAGSDQRRVAIFLTEQGMTAATAVLDGRRDLLHAAVTALEPGERQALEGMLDKLLTAVTTDFFQAERTCRLCDLAVCPPRICPVELAGGGPPSPQRQPRPRAVPPDRRRPPA
ncbi:MAG TPA: MarR family transcriptional regulator [Streptosporangiaceae bacterium]